MAWWGWVLIGWVAAMGAVGVAIGRMIRTADRIEQPTPQLDRPLGLVADEPGRPDPSLPGAILALAYCVDETDARYWLAQCARRGADWNLQRQLWEHWQREHARDVTTLHTDTEDDL